MLALHLFNAHLRDTGPGRSYVRSARTFLSYGMTVSPRSDRLLVIVPSAVDNAVGRLMAPPAELAYNVPGLRLAAAHDFKTYHIVHLPTGARMTLASRPDYESEQRIHQRGPRAGQWSTREFATLDAALTPVGQEALQAIPPMTVGAETLLAALASRMSTSDPGGRWAMGHWWTDPLLRSEPPGYTHDGLMYLWGCGRPLALALGLSPLSRGHRRVSDRSDYRSSRGRRQANVTGVGDLARFVIGVTSLR